MKPENKDIKLNKRTKKIISIILIYLLTILLIIFKISLNINIIIGLVYSFILLLGWGFEDDVRKIISSFFFAGILFTLVVIMFSWILGFKVPFTNLSLTDNTIIAIFTIVLAFTSIITVGIYKKSIDLARLPILDFLVNEDLTIKVENKGVYPARDVNIEIEFIDRILRKSQRLSKRIIKDRTIDVQEENISYLSNGKTDNIDIREYIKKRFNLEEKFNNRDEFLGYISKNNEKINFLMKCRLTFCSDQFAKNSFPINKKFAFVIEKDIGELSEL